MRAPNVYGGSATVQTVTPIRMINVVEPRPFSSTLDLQIDGSPVELLVQSGASQTSISRLYSSQSGRVILPIFGDFVTVDVGLPAGSAPGAAATIRALLAIGAAANAPVSLSVGHAGGTVLPIGTTAIAGALAAARAIYNGTPGNLQIAVGGAVVWEIATLQTLQLTYTGPIDLITAAGGMVTICDFQI